MATTIANLRIQLSASTKGLQKPLSQAKNSIKGFRDGVNSTSFGLGGLATKLIGVAAGFLTLRAVLRSVTRSLETLDRIGKISVRLGVTAEALQKMRFAGELTGVAITAIDTSLQRFTKNLAKANEGSTELAKVFQKDLNLNVKELIELPLEQQMIRFADALRRVRTQADRVRIAAALLDSEGVALLQTFEGGGENLARLFREAEKVGIFSTQDIRQAEAANDAMLRVSKTLEFIAGQFAIEIAPAIESVAESLQKMGLTGEFAGKVVSASMKQLNKELLINQLRALRVQLTFARITGNNALIDETSATMRKLRKELERVRKAGEETPGKPAGPGALSLQDQLAAIGSAVPQPAFKAAGSVAAFSAVQGAARKDRFKDMIAAQQAAAEEERKQTEKLTMIERKLTPVVPALI